LLAFWSAVSVYSFFVLLERNRRIDWYFFIFISVFGFYIHFSYVVLLVAQIAILLHQMGCLFKEKSRLYAWSLLLGGVLAVAISAPRLWFLNITLNRFEQGFWVPMPNFFSFLRTIENFLCGYNLSMPVYYFIGGVAVLLMAYAFYLRFWSTQYPRLDHLWVLVIVPFVLVYAFSYFLFPIYLDRFLMPVTPVFFILLSIGLCAVRPKVLQYSLFFMLIASQCWGVRAYFLNEMPTLESQHHVGVHLKKAMKAPALYLNDHIKEGDGVAFSSISACPSFVYYGLGVPLSQIKFLYGKGAVHDVLRFPIEESIQNVPFDKISLLPFKRIWVVSTDWNRSGVVQADDKNSWIGKRYMDKHFKRISEKEFEGLFVSLYLLRG
jgi:hypothetical protein